MAVRLNTERKGVSLVWDEVGEQEVTVYATGEGGDVHNKLPQVNTGEAGVFYPGDFSGSSHIEIRDAEGNPIWAWVLLGALLGVLVDRVIF